MKIIEHTLSEDGLEENDYCDQLKITIDGKTTINLFDGEPEDMTLNRNLNCCYSIMEMLEKVYEMGKNGDVVEFEYIAHDDLDEF